MKYFGVFFISFVFFLLIDFIFLKCIMGPWYVRTYPEILRQSNGVVQVNYLAAVMCYVLMVVCFNYFCAQLPLTASWSKVLWQGFLLGVTFYGVFDLTNLAVLQAWEWGISLVEILWGGIIGALTYSVIFYCLGFFA